MFDLNTWLNSGAIFFLGDNKYLLSCEHVSKSSEPQENPSYFAPDFYLNEKESWYQFRYHKVWSSEDIILELQSLNSIDSLQKLNTWKEPSLLDLSLIHI